MSSVSEFFRIFTITCPHVIVGPVCYSCQNIPHPRDCGRIVQCGDSEVSQEWLLVPHLSMYYKRLVLYDIVIVTL